MQRITVQPYSIKFQSNSIYFIDIKLKYIKINTIYQCITIAQSAIPQEYSAVVQIAKNKLFPVCLGRYKAINKSNLPTLFLSYLRAAYFTIPV